MLSRRVVWIAGTLVPVVFLAKLALPAWEPWLDRVQIAAILVLFAGLGFTWRAHTRRGPYRGPK